MEDLCNGSVVWVSFHWVHSFSRSTDVHKSMRVIEVKHRASVKGNPSPSPQKMIKFDLKELFGGINVIYVSEKLLKKMQIMLASD